MRCASIITANSGYWRQSSLYVRWAMGLWKLALEQGRLLLVWRISPFIAYSLAGIEAAAYSVLLSAMAAMAWNSNFPRYRVGMGAMLFVASDLLLFGREGGALAHIPAIGPAIDPAIWYSYYAGMVLIATGIVQTLIKRGYSSEEEGPSS
jgi:uncharacterized membrane protein YhhN